MCARWGGAIPNFSWDAARKAFLTFGDGVAHQGRNAIPQRYPAIGKTSVKMAPPSGWFSARKSPP